MKAHREQTQTQEVQANTTQNTTNSQSNAARNEQISSSAQQNLSASITSTLRYGARGAMVEKLQQALVALGYMTTEQMATGPGIFGRRTQASVMAFQTNAKITVDGIVGSQTLGKMDEAMGSGSAQAPAVNHNTSQGASRETSVLTGNPVLQLGMEGILIKELQRLLNQHGGKLRLDGEFGPKTAAAVRSFQEANNMTGDGKVGTDTVALLYSGTANSFVIQASNSSGNQGVQPGPPMELNIDDADPQGRLSDSRINPTMRNIAIATIQELQRQGYSPYVVGGFRSFSEQDAYYEQGRTKEGPIVTWVRGGGSWHNYGLAVDIAFWNASHTAPSWHHSHPWQLLGSVGKAAGFTRWMGDTNSDLVHFEHHPNWGNKCSDLASTYLNQGLQAVWDKVL